MAVASGRTFIHVMLPARVPDAKWHGRGLVIVRHHGSRGAAETRPANPDAAPGHTHIETSRACARTSTTPSDAYGFYADSFRTPIANLTQ